MLKQLSHPSLSGLLMVAGTAIGAGMIGLPVALAEVPTSVIFISLGIIWALMLLTAHYFVEVSFQFPMHDNLISLTKKSFNNASAIAVSFIYLAFLYALMGAYLSGSASLLRSNLSPAGTLAPSWALLICSAVCALCVKLGPRLIDKLNKILMFVLLGAYLHMISGLWFMPTHQAEPMPFSWSFLKAVPIIVTSFGFHLLIPSLSAYLKQDLKNLKRSLWGGSTLALIIYSLWIGSILYVIPRIGPTGLISMKHFGNPAELLANALSQINPALGRSLAIFSFCALTTSLLGVALGLYDFIQDGLKVYFGLQKPERLALTLSFMPPAVFVLIDPNGFLTSLRYAAACSVILLCLLPISLSFATRYRARHLNQGYQVWGGTVLLLGALVMSCLIFLLALFVSA